MIQLPPYGELTIEGRKSVAYIDGNAPWIFVRTGSDCLKIGHGNSIPVDSDYVALVNPFPRPVSLLIGRNMPLMVSAGANWPLEADVNMRSSMGKYQAAGAAPGLKFGIGVMLQRGRSQVEFVEGTNDGFSKVIIFAGASKNFLSFKPAGMMIDGTKMRHSDGAIDTATLCVSGTYTEPQIAEWITAAGYVGEMSTMNVGSYMHTIVRYQADTETAVFYVRDADKLVNVTCRMTHLGDGPEAFR